MQLSKAVADIIDLSFAYAEQNHYEYVTPEVILYAFAQNYIFRSAFAACDGDINQLIENLLYYLEENLKLEEVSSTEDDGRMMKPKLSVASGQLLLTAQAHAQSSGRQIVEMTHLLYGIWQLEESYAVYFMAIQDVDETAMLQAMIDLLEEWEEIGQEDSGVFCTSDHEGEEAFNAGESTEGKESQKAKKEAHFTEYAPCMNEQLADRNPLIGRENELERTIQILCRKDKNNPLHIGEAGVGKTAITYGLAKRINDGRVPQPLKGARIYALDLGSLLAGTQYRGDLEKRLKKLLEEIHKEENPIIYIDEIHNLAGAGAVGESSFDVSNLLKPYLADGSIRFIGATTYEEYKKYFEKNKSLARRFQNVEISQPSEEETIKILQGLKRSYEKFHGVKYGKGILEYIVGMSAKHINERFLPDKAIDLMDEAGAYRKIHPLDQKTQSVGRDVINEILTTICHVPIDVSKEEDQNLSDLEDRILSKVFGQDQAVKQIVNAIKYSRAGLLADHKPLSSFLFAGPTGVGKTEIAKTLAEELGIPLVRFDMSEYGEKHAVAKLIGSPAGYVGYEEGGLLTEAIRKNPNCVLLLDEIEKAHPDIFHVLLQMMDYATLTDNQGRKADFRNVIIIMTSNAGASQIGKRGIGFQKNDVTSSIISEEIKRIFQPEFRNRLNQIVVFQSMNEAMGERIAGKKLGELADLLARRKVTFLYQEDVISLLSQKGTSIEYGAREMDRVIEQEIKPLFVDELLFGKLKKGGTCLLHVEEDHFLITCEKRKHGK